jgi:hypothetical protein
MPDERLDSMRQGIGAPPESPAAQKADAERRDQVLRAPSPVPMESAMGGTSDAGRAGDDVDADAVLRGGISGGGGGHNEDAVAAGDAGDVRRETREAGQRAQGGGSRDEGNVRPASQDT